VIIIACTAHTRTGLPSAQEDAGARAFLPYDGAVAGEFAPLPSEGGARSGLPSDIGAACPWILSLG